MAADRPTAFRRERGALIRLACAGAAPRARPLLGQQRLSVTSRLRSSARISTSLISPIHGFDLTDRSAGARLESEALGCERAAALRVRGRGRAAGGTPLLARDRQRARRRRADRTRDEREGAGRGCLAARWPSATSRFAFDHRTSERRRPAPAVRESVCEGSTSGRCVRPAADREVPDVRCSVSVRGQRLRRARAEDPRFGASPPSPPTSAKSRIGTSRRRRPRSRGLGVADGGDRRRRTIPAVRRREATSQCRCEGLRVLRDSRGPSRTT
jgi:hypothetical protein